MAEDDEIDVLGDFSLDNFLSNNDSSIYESTALVSQNTELLNCEYTIHPQWLLDKPSADPDNWYDSNLPSGLVDKSQAENDTLGHVSTANSITDESGWTEMEKNLLERENQGTYRQFNDGVVKEISNSNLVSDVLDDTQIPASIEVIAAVSTGKPTVQVNKRQKKSGGSSDTSEINVRGTLSGHAHLKANCINLKKLKTPKSKKYELHKNKRKQKNVKFKFKANLKNQTKQKEDDHNKRPGFSHIEITTGKGLAVPICEGEEIVKINTGDEESDLDIEIDIEDLNEDIKKIE
ncbi:hypothetical protein NQ317_014734 [Molorchus minor]|uniref:Uncharacterized protein n=1 Tax=Molorchus minor TaxID=1323400 RepID=A0ABQ9J2D0_9CUCU|nr:hypothetical protein NQ317_014734 [Molorchus minor]